MPLRAGEVRPRRCSPSSPAPAGVERALSHPERFLASQWSPPEARPGTKPSRVGLWDIAQNGICGTVAALRRGSHRRLLWSCFGPMVDRWIPKARILYPHPNLHVSARHPRQQPSAVVPHAGICAGGAARRGPTAPIRPENDYFISARLLADAMPKCARFHQYFQSVQNRQRRKMRLLKDPMYVLKIWQLPVRYARSRYWPTNPRSPSLLSGRRVKRRSHRWDRYGLQSA